MLVSKQVQMNEINFFAHNFKCMNAGRQTKEIFFFLVPLLSYALSLIFSL